LPAPAPALSEADRQRRIRELWENDRTGQARALFAEMLEPMQADLRSRFEAERLDQVAAPIARAWRRDGPDSRIAATTFFKWLAQVTWPEEPSDRVLLDFALQRGVPGL
jgi:phytoene dehydrogenase-like protein